MKKKITSIFITLSLLLSVFSGISLPVFALESGDYQYEVADNKATIIAYTGTGTDITIPSSLDGYSVTSIGEGAFSGCDSLTSINIPDSVTSIGDWAFSNCSGFTSITIPNSVISIGNSVFAGCSSLSSINVETGNQNYSSLEGVLFNKDKTTILSYPSGKKDTSYTMPNSVTSIGDYAFSDCISLTSITISNSVTSIVNSMFSGCDSLTSINIPDSVTSIDGSAFLFCSSLESINVETRNQNYSSLEGVLFNKDKTTILSYPSGKKDTSYTMPNSVTSIENFAFSDCISLASITIPEGVTSIGDGAFSGCSSLTSITIPEGVTSIGDGAFSGCSSLISITIPKGVTSIGDGAFFGCTSLISINVETENQNYLSLEGVLFNKDKTTILNYPSGKKDTSYTIPNGVTSIGDATFFSCISLTSITIPNGVTSIGDAVFFGCSSITSITIPNGVTSIGGSAFFGCISLTSISIPDSVTSIGDGMFFGCSSLANIDIPNSVTSIGIGAFLGTAWFDNQSDGLVYAGLVAYSYKGIMTEDTRLELKDGTKCIAGGAFLLQNNLTSISIPDSVTDIGSMAFSGCSSLASIDIPNSVTSIGDGAFSGTAWFDNQPDGLVYVGLFAYSYKGTMPEDTRLEIKDETKGIAGGAFFGQINLTSISIPNSVTSIGDYAFFGCISLTSITIPESVTSIGNDAFSFCDQLLLKCYQNSYALDYAKNNNLNFETIITFTVGDVDNDGSINVSDAVMILQVITGKTDSPAVGSQQFSAIDNNYDGAINVSDVLRLLQLITGKISSL